VSSMKDAGPRRERIAEAAPRLVAGALFGASVVVTAAVAAWPIYRDWSFVLLVLVAVAVAAVIAAGAWWLRWSGWVTAGAVFLAFLVLGIPLAIPSRLGAPSELVTGLRELGTGAVLGWKDLLTVDLPVGSYRNLMVPLLVVFLVGTCALLSLSWRQDQVAFAAVPVALGMTSFGLFFGRATVSAPFELGPVFLSAPMETALGLATLLSSLLWLAWRTHDRRIRSLQRAAVSSGVRISRPSRPASGRARRRHGRRSPRHRRGGRAVRGPRRRPRGSPLHRWARDRSGGGGQPPRRVPVAVQPGARG